MRGHAVVELKMQYQQTHPVGESERRSSGDVGFGALVEKWKGKGLTICSRTSSVPQLKCGI